MDNPYPYDLTGTSLLHELENSLQACIHLGLITHENQADVKLLKMQLDVYIAVGKEEKVVETGKRLGEAITEHRKKEGKPLPNTAYLIDLALHKRNARWGTKSKGLEVLQNGKKKKGKA
jgi:hypothetical protein